MRQRAKKVLALIGDETLPESSVVGRSRSSSAVAPPPMPEVDLMGGFEEEGGNTYTGVPPHREPVDLIGALIC